MLHSRTTYSISSRSIAALVDSLPAVETIEIPDFGFNNTHLVDSARSAVSVHNDRAQDDAATVAP
jgi:hypothetical protein